ncbi:MAG: PAS domain S-box protein [Bacteroidetes bacterium]|nr:PAS domain S-box protein [Bacteroidota bacterium]
MPLKILMLEDNESDAMMIQHQLTKAGINYTYRLMMTREAYEKALLEFEPDLVLSDNAMPQFSASEALAILQQMQIHIPFILVTGTVSEEFAAGIIKAGADDYLLKDRLIRLPNAIEAALKQKQFEKQQLQDQEQLRLSEEKYRTLVEQASDGIFIADETGKFIIVNSSGCKMSGYTLDELQTRTIYDLVEPESLKKIPFNFQEMMMPQGASSHRQMLRKNGQLVHVEINAKFLSDKRFIAFVRDIGERIIAQDEIRQTNEKLRELTAHLINVREEERKRIGREIHDELGQQLTAIKMDVSWIHKKIPSDAYEPIQAKLKNIITLLDGSNQSIRRILSELRPGVLDDNGLIEALEWQNRQFATTTGIAIHFETTEKELKLPEQAATCIFRVYQEALTNIIRHADATRVNTALKKDNGNVVVTIEDNGKGFDTKKRESKKSFGILGIKERVHAQGGELFITSAPGKGTKMEIRLFY